MPYYDFFWDLENDPDGNHRHVAQHGLTPEDVEHVVKHPRRTGKSRSSQRPIAIGRTLHGELIAVVYELIDSSTVYPITAYPLED
jgi:uncharacterized DUF497 family protein